MDSTEKTNLILLVDDNKNACKLLGMVLTQRGFDVIEAHDGATGLELATSTRPKVALIDIGMPVMNGIELVREIRARESDHRILCVALTGDVNDDARESALAAGFDEHFCKPVRPSIIAEYLSDKF
ncbi:MAG: hypothetical protein Aurels2KO_49120 [Aureliella sp.]